MNTMLGRYLAAGGLLLLAAPLAAQKPRAKPAKAPRRYTAPAIFAATTPLEFTLTAPFGLVKREREGTATYRVAEITYVGDHGTVRLPVRVRPRGIWRRKNCDVPPLRLSFKNDSTRQTVFHHLDDARLAMPCRGGDQYEQYMLQEFQLYRVQRLVTPLSFDVRLVRVTYVDAQKKDTLARRRYGFLQEEDGDFGARVGGTVVTTKGATDKDVDGAESALFGLFQYMIGNTDFSISALHNIVLLQKDTSYYPIAHDFDWSGAVNTSYAFPAALLKTRKVTERVMRGYCTTPANYEKAIALFKAKKPEIYALYHDAIGSLMKPDIVKQTLEYFDEFYDILNDPRSYRRLIIEACLGGRA